jgi:cytochrome c-type biogenesis protein CcmH/NrfG
MTYFRIFAISVCSSLLFLSIFIAVAFDSENTLNKSYEHFANKEYYEARQLLVNEDNSIPLADFYLYEAYLAREELGIKKSQRYLTQALQELSSKKSSTALEITLNLALDAFLQKDAEALQDAIEQGKQYAAADEAWIHYFAGYHAYLLKDYAQALKSWETGKSRHWLSNWMKTSFESYLPHDEAELKHLHAEIETGQIWTSRKKLEQYTLTLSPEKQEDVQFLLALSYIKEGNNLPYEQRSFAYQKSIGLLQKISAKHPSFLQEKRSIMEAYKEQILSEIFHDHFTNLSSYVTSLENWQAKEQLEKISLDITKNLNEKVMTGHFDEASLQKLYQSLPEGELKRMLTAKLAMQMYQMISKGNVKQLQEYWTILQDVLPPENSALPVLADATATKILDLIENDSTDFEKTLPYIKLWDTLEKNPRNRYSLAQQLIYKAQRFWSVNGESSKALALMKISQTLPFAEEKHLLQQDIERAVVKTYRQAVLQDHVHEFPFIQTAIKEFNLADSEILTPEETANQLADAQYLFNIELYPLASKKAAWVIQVDPENQTARRIAILIAYEEGRYREVLEHARFLRTTDNQLNEAFAVSQIIAGNSAQGIAFLNTLEERSLSNDIALRLGFGYLIKAQPDKSLPWLDKLSQNDETAMAFYIAAFQKQEWEKVILQFAQLSKDQQQIVALQGMLIQALIAQRKEVHADEVFSKFLASTSPQIEGSKPFQLLQTHLENFDANDFAARYFLYVKKDPENALKKFREVKNPTKTLFLERGELAYSLKNYTEAIQNLYQASIQSTGQSRERALDMLGNIYLQLGFYPDSVHYFKELFQQNPRQNPAIHQSYSQALLAIGRMDLAIPHYNHLGMALPTALLTPQEMDTILNIDSSNRLCFLEEQFKLYPGSVSIKIVWVKELIQQSEKSPHRSEDLLLANQTLEDILRAHPYIPEAWFLHGYVHSQLKFNKTAKKSFSQSIALNPHYVDSYMQLAFMNLNEKDLLAATYNLKQILQLLPNDAQIWSMLAQTYEMQHLKEEAIKAWTEASKLHPDNPLYYVKIAQVQLALHKPQDAILAIEHAISLSPGNNDYWKILQQALKHPNNGKISQLDQQTIQTKSG